MIYQKVDFKVDSMLDRTIWIWYKYVISGLEKSFEIIFLVLAKTWCKVEKIVNFCKYRFKIDMSQEYRR